MFRGIITSFFSEDTSSQYSESYDKPPFLTIILTIFFVQKMSSANYVCYTNTLPTNLIMEANTMNPNQTAPEGAI